MSEGFEKYLHKFKLGDIYLDGAYHPTICLRIDIDHERKDIGLAGISLFDGSYPRSCSVMHSAPDKITCEEALDMKQEYEASRRPRNEKLIEIMCYADGQEVMEGDKVALENDEGEVYAVIDRNRHPSSFGENIWEGYKKRVVMRFSKRGFAHFIREIDGKISLISRGASRGEYPHPNPLP